MIGQITARLSTPLLIDQDFNLDGMLTFVRARALDLPVPTRQTPLSEIPKIAIPLDVVEHGGHRVFLSTAAVYAGDAPYRARWTRRRDASDVEAMDATFSPGAGPGRNMMVLAHGIMSSSASWFVSTSDLDAVMALLADVTALGKVRRHGYGVVRAWECAECPDLTPRDLLVRKGVAMRSLPADWLVTPDHGQVRMLAVSLPYWHPETQIRGVPAGSRVDLRPEVLGC